MQGAGAGASPAFMAESAPVFAQAVLVEWLREYQRVDPFHGGGVITALVLIVVLALLLPPGERRYVRAPVLFLLLHVLLLVLDLLPAAGYVKVPFEYVSLFFLLICVVRTTFLLCTRSRPARALFQPLPKIFLDAIQGLAYLCIGLIVLSSAQVDASSLLTGGAVAAALFGFLMKDTLGNLLAGLAMQGERPFEVGDWIQFDQDKSRIGKVQEINWRSTKVKTLDDVEVIVPNSVLAQYPIVNFTKPDPWARRSIFFLAPYSEPTEKVRRIVLEAIADSWGVLKHPPPSVVTNDFAENGVQYWVRIFTTEFDSRDRVDGGVRDRIWHALRRHDIVYPIPQRDVHMKQPESAESRQLRRKQALQCVDFLNVLPPEFLDELAEAAQLRHYATGEVIIRQGDPGDELFIIIAGEVAAQIRRDDGSSVEVARLGPDSFFGEMSLMTGQKRSATIVATKGVDVFVIDHDDLAPILASSPEMVNVISETLEARQASLAAARSAAMGTPHVPQPKDTGILQRIREFFHLG